MKTLLGKKERRRPEEDPLPARISNNNNDYDDVEPSTTYRSFASIPRMRPSPSSNNNSNNNNTSAAVIDPLEAPNESNNNNSSSNNTTTTNNNYRGFDTSIADMFRYRQHERTDCCALTCCCGVLQSDRDRFLLTGIPPVRWIKRCTVHVVTPLTIFLVAGIGALHIPDAAMNQLFCTALLFMLIGYGIAACAKGRAKRIAIRKDLMFTKYQVLQQQQQQQQHDNDHSLSFLLEQERPHDGGENEDDDDAYYYLGQGRWDFACAHPPCCGLGCYVEDRPQQQKRDTDTNDDTTTKDDLSTCLWSCLAHPCCGMHLQCCGVCAVAQEARELERTVLPPRYRRIDYITMQPVMEYYPAIYQAKWRNRARRHPVVVVAATAAAASSNVGATAVPSTQPMQQRPDMTNNAEALAAAEAGESIRDMMDSPDDSYTDRTGISFPPPLSKLSKRLVSWLFVIFILVMTYSVLAPLYFRYVLHDKLRARIAFSLADFGVFALVFGQAFVLLALLAWITNRPKFAELSFDAMVKFFASGFLLSTSLAVFWELVLGLVVRVLVSLLLAIGGVDTVDDPETTKQSFLSFVPWSGGGMAMDWIPFDLPTVADSSRGSSRDYLESFGRAHPVWYTLYILVVTFVLAAFVEELCKYFGYRMCDEHPDFMSQQELKDASHIVFASGGHDDDTEEDGEHHSHHHHRQHEVENNNNNNGELAFAQQRQSYQAQGAAVTLAMLCVAMGFTCCENLVYVFIYSSTSPNMELSVLFARSIFPVHAICAAIQSIGVCQRDIECDRSAKLGRSIIFPAVLFHGSYDFFIVWIDFLANRKLGVAANDDDATGVDASKSYEAALASFVISVCLIVGALFYYGREARKQRRRLAAMDEQVTLERSRLV